MWLPIVHHPPRRAGAKEAKDSQTTRELGKARGSDKEAKDLSKAVGRAEETLPVGLSERKGQRKARLVRSTRFVRRLGVWRKRRRFSEVLVQPHFEKGPRANIELLVGTASGEGGG